VTEAAVVYNYPRALERELAKLRTYSVGKENSETILRFYRQLVAEGLGLARIIKHLNILRQLALLLDKPFMEATKDDIVSLVAKIENRNYSEWTKHDYKQTLKRLYRWLRGCEDEYPPEVKWIKFRGNLTNSLEKKDLLQIEEIQAIADSARNLRDKAFIWVYFESMRRLGEILTLRIGSVEFDDLGARLFVNGKMGRDHGRIITSVPLLSAWLNMHPKKDDPSAPLWVTLGSKNTFKQLSYGAVRSVLKDCAQRAGIKKRVWLYLIRHSRITPASKILPHSLLCATAGWKQGSRMPSVYIHLAGEDVDEAQCILSGTAAVERKEEQLKPIVCKRCQTSNLPGSKFCSKCGAPLDLKTAVQLDQTRVKLDRLLDKLTEDPQKLEKLLTLVESA
jgi:integrase/recombinase XerD